MWLPEIRRRISRIWLLQLLWQVWSLPEWLRSGFWSHFLYTETSHTWNGCEPWKINSFSDKKGVSPMPLVNRFDEKPITPWRTYAMSLVPSETGSKQEISNSISKFSVISRLALSWRNATARRRKAFLSISCSPTFSATFSTTGACINRRKQEASRRNSPRMRTTVSSAIPIPTGFVSLHFLWEDH